MSVDTAEFYVRRIRNARKRSYARSYLRWLRQGPNGPRPSCPPIAGQLSYMAAQAVRLTLHDLVRLDSLEIGQ